MKNVGLCRGCWAFCFSCKAAFAGVALCVRGHRSALFWEAGRSSSFREWRTWYFERLTLPGTSNWMEKRKTAQKYCTFHIAPETFEKHKSGPGWKCIYLTDTHSVNLIFPEICCLLQRLFFFFYHCLSRVGFGDKAVSFSVATTKLHFLNKSVKKKNNKKTPGFWRLTSPWAYLTSLSDGMWQESAFFFLSTLTPEGLSHFSESLVTCVERVCPWILMSGALCSLRGDTNSIAKSRSKSTILACLFAVLGPRFNSSGNSSYRTQTFGQLIGF